MKNELLLLVVGLAVAGCENPPPPTLIAHQVRLDHGENIVAWTSYAKVMRLAWNRLQHFPTETNGLPAFFSYPRFEGAPNTSADRALKGIWWAFNPAGLTAMLIDGALGYGAYSGDYGPLALARQLADHQLAHGTTPADFDWARVPYASANPGSLEWSGGDDKLFCGGKECGRGDGVGFIEPDKVGELGMGYLRLYEHGEGDVYLTAAIACADALAAHAAAGDETHSPWPFRVDAKTGKIVREPYSSNVIGPIMLFAELERLKLGQTASYTQARTLAWNWLMAYPIVNHNWQGYFEDIPIHLTPGQNPNQYSPVETAKYLMKHPELDADWQAHVTDTLDWVAETFTVDVTTRFGLEAGHQWGAEVLSEQNDDMAKMSSHTARFASALALLSAVTGDESARDRARLSLNWVTYACDERGVVKVGTNDDEGYWFSDGYGDYMRHFLDAMAAQPEWAPAGESHLLGSTSIVKSVSYARARIEYETFDAASTEVLRLKSAPKRVTVDGQTLGRVAALGDGEGYSSTALDGGGVVLRVRHAASGKIAIALH